MDNIQSFLKLEKLVFDNIIFKRCGFKNDNELTYKITTAYGVTQIDNIYRANIIFNGEKKDEYTIEISISGFFSVQNSDDLEKNIIDDLISKNAVAIILPYLRSQLTLATTQPDVDPVILPVINVNKLLQKDND